MANGGLICVVRDITERKQMEDIISQSEERYRTILDEMDNGYFEVDLAVILPSQMMQIAFS